VPAVAVEAASPAGTVWAWGDNDFGQLGNGTNTSSNVAVQVNLASGVTITNIAGGQHYSLALASNGMVWAWGYGVNGELGNGTNTVSNIPVQVSLPNGVTITNIVGGAYHSLALASNGTVWAWGYNNFGQLGNGTNTSSNIPVQVSLPSLPSGATITNIAGGAYHSLALASNGTVWAWGDNDFGELGNGTNTSSNIPVQVSLPSGVTITNIAGGVSGHSLALASNGTVWAWGYGVNGELGNGTNTVSNIPVQVSLPNGVTITNIVGGGDHNLALASNGTVWAWGYNNFGQLGNATNTSSNVPVQVSLPSGVTITNIASGSAFSLALASNGTVWAWGSNWNGQLGNGTNTSSNIPVQVSLPSGVTITNIAGGAYHILTLGIIVGSTTATTLTSSANPSNHGQSVTFTATINPVPDGGTVQFQDNGVNINPQINIDSSGQAICTTSTLSIGTHTITAVYTGDTNFASSTGTLTQTVNPSPILKISADDDVSSILQSAANDFYNDTGIVLDITIKSDSQAIQDLNNGNCDIAGVGTISGN
jgi:alpha-tubulin suppressor-like RCC1 family protein